MSQPVKITDLERRRATELAVITHLVDELLAEGCCLSVSYGPGVEDPVGCDHSYVREVILGSLRACDEETLIVYRGHRDVKPYGQIFLVYGNDGWDVINDYNTGLEPLIGHTINLVEELSEHVELQDSAVHWERSQTERVVVAICAVCRRHFVRDVNHENSCQICAQTAAEEAQS